MKFSPPQLMLGVSFVVGLIYLFFPMTTSRYDIHFDREAIAEKKAFLRITAQNAKDTATRPNIIIITADDLGKTDISLYGSPHVQTQHIDRLGHTGATFTEGYSTSPICSPSRAATLTGRYQQRFGYELQPQNRYPHNRMEYYAFKYLVDTDHWKVNSNMRYPDEQAKQRQGLPPEEYALSDLLKPLGYATGMMGKWHMGHAEPLRPTDHGFDVMYGFYEAFTLFADTTDPGIVNHQHADFSNDYIWGKGREGKWAIRRNEDVVEEDEYLTYAIARESNKFIQEHSDQPFFLYIPFNAPHTPFQATREDFERFAHVEDRNKRVYYAMIYALDQAVGSIVSTLDSLGLRENTLICFASDNGGATYTLATDNAPLKGGKMSMFEGGINVPFVMNWPGIIPDSIVFEHPVTLMDFFGTAVDVAGLSLPEDRVFDGINLLPYLTKDKRGAPHEAIYWKAGPSKAIRKGKWKMIVDESRGYRLLYDLDKDKEETNNLYREQPDVVKELNELLDEWDEGLMEPMWPNIMDFETKADGRSYFFPA